MQSPHGADPTATKSTTEARTRPLPRLTAALVLLLGGCGGALAEDDGGGPTTWRFAIEETSGSVQDAYAQEFKRRVEERTDGEVEVKVYPYGTLGTSDDLTEQLRMGALQFAMASPGHLGKTIPELQIFLLHFLFDDDDDVNRRALSDPEFRARIEALFPPKDMALIGLLTEGWMVWTTKKEVRTPEDFDGVKIRTMTSPLLLAAYRAYGASPQGMPYGEVYSGLQLNMIDAQVNPIFAIEEMSFYEVTSHMVRAQPAPFLATVVANADFLEALPPERRRMVLEVAAELEEHTDRVQQELNQERLDRILERKPDMEIVELTDEERARFRELALPVRESYVEQAGPRGEALLDALVAAIERAQQGD